MKTTFTVLISIAWMQIPAGAIPEAYRKPLPPAHTIQLAPAGLLPIQPYDAMREAMGAEKTAATGSRITTQYSSAGTAAGAYRSKDSMFYTYSGIRGGDLNGNINFDIARAFRWDTVANLWRPNYLYTNTFDAQNRVTAQVVQNWNSGSSVFDNMYRYSFSYNAQGRATMIKTESWNAASSVWANNSQYTGFNYNGSGKVTTYTYQTWKTSGGVWVNSLRYNASYNANGDPTTWVTELWNTTTSAWGNMYNETYTYNAAKKNTRYTYQSWDAPGSMWRNDLAYNYFYNGSNQEVGYARQIGSQAGSAWVNTDSAAYTTLNSMGSPVIEVNYIWNGAGWQQQRRYSYSYTSTNLESSWMREDWNGNDFVEVIRDLSTYNSYGQLKDYTGQTWNGSNWIIGSADPFSRYNYQTHSLGTGNSVVATPQVLLYPNPVQQLVTLSIDWNTAQAFSVGVYDITGRVWQSWAEGPVASYERQVDVSGLPVGVYSLRVNSGAANWTKTFAVQH